jgi:threonine dehydrogenase-like Zn-dependent dehydrogenase
MTIVAVVGLGYVGLPLAVEFGKKHRTIGFDLSASKVAHYRQHVDPTGEVSSADLKAAVHLEVGTDAAALKEADFVIVAVPTPVDRGASAGFFAADRCLGSRWCEHEARCDGGIRIDGLSRRDRGRSAFRHREIFRDEVEAGFQRRLFAGADQPG